ncbi:MAG TPA: helix-turn-helix domain-containing protein [Mucilaginibacter sp.]|jgi:predicted DNA-binding transcriptional regulator AlpA
METLTFDQLPKAVSLLLEKVSHLEELLLANENNSKRIEQSIDVNQAARFLNMAVQTLYGKVSRKEVPVNKQGKHLHFYISELEEWLRKGRKRTFTEIKESMELSTKRRRYA